MPDEIIELNTPRHRSSFGEFLVEQQILDRFQLFRALQMQDRVPGLRLGQCAATLGYVPRLEIEKLHHHFTRTDRDLESSATQAFDREPEIEISFSIS